MKRDFSQNIAISSIISSRDSFDKLISYSPSRLHLIMQNSVLKLLNQPRYLTVGKILNSHEFNQIGDISNDYTRCDSLQSRNLRGRIPISQTLQTSTRFKKLSYMHNSNHTQTRSNFKLPDFTTPRREITVVNNSYNSQQ